MNIKIIREIDHPSYLTGGECAVLTVEIYVDSTLPDRMQRELVIHAIIESFCLNWEHEKVEELTDSIMDGLDMLEEIK